MFSTHVKKTGLLIMALGFGLAAGGARAGVSKAMGEMKHALGWDALNLKVVERDSGGRPTFERDSNGANKVERRTKYHGNGKKASQETLVVAKDSGKTLYTEKQSWDDSGRLEKIFVQDDDYHADGKQVRGENSEKEYDHGRLVKEVKKKYSAESGSWGTVYEQTVSYYDNGDMKERVTEEPPKDRKTKESWGDKGAMGRKKTTHRWNASKNEWD
jgi:hypothetical protein